MSKLDIGSAAQSDLTNRVENFEIAGMQTDAAAQNQDETEYLNSNWSQQWGDFNQVEELKQAITMKAVWTVGKGWTADPMTTVILNHITGWGKDTFDDILFNLEVVKRVGGDAFCEIIRDEDSGELINLKPLDTGSIKIIVNRKGQIIRYEQINKVSKAKEVKHKFKPEEILHFCHNRLADQIHGISDIDVLRNLLLAEGESFADIKKLMHRQARPMIVFKLGTDNQVKIDAFIAKMDTAYNKGECIYVPDDENTFSFEVIKADLSPVVLAWREEIRNKFYRSIGVPQIIFGSGKQSESGGKIEYLAHEQVFEKDQHFIERQIEEQLGLKINLIPPVSLLENLQTDENKDANQGMEIQPADLTAGRGK